jgi:acetyl-CoA carboxylase biotin carboxyl carrier protein
MMSGGGKRERKRAMGRSQAGSSVSVDDVTALIGLMDAHRLVEIEIENRGSKIRLVRDRAGEAASPSAAPADATNASGAVPSALASSTDSQKPIISPMVGTFYRAPSPEAPPFVDVGSIVDKGDTLCIIEAMKMMNEIEAEFRGRVARVVAENGQTVEYGEPLFLIEPL